MPFEDNMEAIFNSNHMFMSWKYFLLVNIGARFTAADGYTPIHFSKKEYFNYGGYGWGVR